MTRTAIHFSVPARQLFVFQSFANDARRHTRVFSAAPRRIHNESFRKAKKTKRETQDMF
jgi:hypothetical protein